jgi:hypothetical protein
MQCVQVPPFSQEHMMKKMQRSVGWCAVFTSQERLMAKLTVRVLVFAVFLAFLFSICVTGIATAGQEETLMGYVVKQGKRFVIEADDGDYIIKGKDVSKLVDKLVEATGIITKSNKEDIIIVRSIEDVQNTLPE